MHKLVKFNTLTTRHHLTYQTRSLSTSRYAFFRKNPGFDEIKVHNEDSLMENAPEWKQSTATESEADIKAEREPEVSPEILKEETAEWVRSHKSRDGSIPPQ
ncbi:uncharacterized protein B0P05DRAFT_572468 [Gilbertella persicaria]|uniref:uncharacterized protein n=1 Tax=Gilbertella persicaria TaxID=101096 RepID=UPI0022201188|nr:uncharacterized protein B0P05DRAFT_572468 [Gilbertella persicaria]KAI8076498.1 hypothetical protein B0P05DRAFT_572468 [Gilbertella persicaria]